MSAQRDPGRRRGRWWLLLFGVALIEVAGQMVQALRVVPPTDWERAAAFVSERWQDGDVATSAPHWSDPLLREVMGERIGLDDAGRSDLVGYRRLWVFSIRGHRAPSSPERAPDETHEFGSVRVDLWSLDSSEREIFDFVDHIESAEVTIVENGNERPCRFQSGGRARGGGLATGPTIPAARHVCAPGRDWLWVGATIEEDLDMLPHRCIWQHPSGAEPIRARFSDVPLGDRLVLYASLWWEHERSLDGGPVDLDVAVNDRELGRVSHEDGDGRARFEFAIPDELRGETGSVSVSVSAVAPNLRSLCWSATMRADTSDSSGTEVSLGGPGEVRAGDSE